MQNLTTIEEFYEFVKTGRVMVLVISDFDGTSKYMKKLVDAEHYYAILLGYLNQKELNFKVGIIDIGFEVEKTAALATHLKIRALPTSFFYKNGERILFSVGADKKFIDFFHSELEVEKGNQSSG